MSQVVLIGSASELGNATALEFINKHPEKYQSLFRVGRSKISSEYVWTNPDDVSKCIISDLGSLTFGKNDMVIVALGYLSEGLLENNFNSLKLDEIYQSIEITGMVSSLVVIKVIEMLELVGGGDLVVFSSVAAQPILKANLFYGASKNFLENIIEGLRKDAKKKNVRISIVRPGFVETKLNKDRAKTSFSTTVDKVATAVVQKFPQKIIYVPHIFRLIGFILSRSRLLRLIANRKIIRSYTR
jgi:decaprenylphospho-beta-D-erythro-pentofuranosid-2-ulose 2-reductase